MERPGTCLTHRINGGGVIVFTDGDWADFARRNGAEGLEGRLLGTSLFSHLDGQIVRDVYNGLIRRVTSTARELSFPFRCDSPELRRYMSMQMLPISDSGVEFRSTLLREEARAPVPTPVVAAGTEPEFVVMCAWCKRVRASGWVEVEEAIPLLGLFGDAASMQISHGICPDCVALFGLDPT